MYMNSDTAHICGGTYPVQYVTLIICANVKYYIFSALYYFQQFMKIKSLFIVKLLLLII